MQELWCMNQCNSWISFNLLLICFCINDDFWSSQMIGNFHVLVCNLQEDWNRPVSIIVLEVSCYSMSEVWYFDLLMHQDFCRTCSEIFIRVHTSATALASIIRDILTFDRIIKEIFKKSLCSRKCKKEGFCGSWETFEEYWCNLMNCEVFILGGSKKRKRQRNL